MQIQGMSGMMPPMPPKSTEEEESLTEEQLALLEEILESFDLENMTQEDYMALGEALKEAEIPPTKETMQIMQEAGLEPMKGGMAPPPPPPMETSMSSMSSEDQSFFEDILTQIESGEIDTEELLAQIEAYTGKTSGTMFDYSA